MADHLVAKGRWVNDGKNAKTPWQTVDPYLHRRIRRLFHYIGHGTFQVRDGLPPDPPGHELSRSDFRLDADDDEVRFPCGCMVFREPDLSVALNWCNLHRPVLHEKP